MLLFAWIAATILGAMAGLVYGTERDFPALGALWGAGLGGAAVLGLWLVGLLGTGVRRLRRRLRTYPKLCYAGRCDRDHRLM